MVEQVSIKIERKEMKMIIFPFKEYLLKHLSDAPKYSTE